MLSAGFMVAVWAVAEPPPYVAHAYPSGGQQGTTFEVELGGVQHVSVRRAICLFIGIMIPIPLTI